MKMHKLALKNPWKDLSTPKPSRRLTSGWDSKEFKQTKKAGTYPVFQTLDILKMHKIQPKRDFPKNFELDILDIQPS